MFARYTSAVASGTVITLSLLFVMQSLIIMQPAAVKPVKNPWSVAWTRIIEETPVQTREDNKPTVEKLTTTLTPPKRIPRQAGTTAVGVALAAPVVGETSAGPVFGTISDGPLVSLIKVQPTYPVRAAERGLEGHVIVELDVTAEGQVVNVRVLESSNSIFNDASIEAAMRFRYRPRVVDGVPQPATGLQNLFRFEMKSN